MLMRSAIIVLRKSRTRLWPYAWVLATFFACLLIKIANADQGGDDDLALSEQRAQYLADAPKTIVELQQFRRAESIAIEGANGGPIKATLVDLNPSLNSWFLLT